jgi:hypothetical protein
MVRQSGKTFRLLLEVAKAISEGNDITCVFDTQAAAESACEYLHRMLDSYRLTHQEGYTRTRDTITFFNGAKAKFISQHYAKSPAFEVNARKVLWDITEDNFYV